MLTDIVGYTSLTQRDESAALRLLEEHRQILRPVLRDHSGREVKTIGDAFLVEFPNALDATRCAIAIQKSMYERNARAAGTKIELRIGLHVGDVVRQNGDILGDAVNLVSRVEPMAEPGGICVSADVYNQVRNKIELSLAPLGAPSLKNVQFPVSLFRVELPWLVTSLARKTPWVARPAEQAVLRQAVERAAKGNGSALVLVGESGVGKTRLAEEIIRGAESEGFRVLRGRAFPGELVTPYSHWAEMVREYLRDAPPALVYKAVGTGAGELVRLVPMLAEKLGPLPPAPTTDPESARVRFYETVTQFFVNLSQESPIVLLFDDLQWADVSSIRLLEFAIRSLAGHRWLILGTSQEPEPGATSPVAEMFRYLRKNDLLTTVPIHRMDAGSVGAMIAKTFGEGEVSEEFRDMIHDRTGGNPFFVEEVLRSLVEEGSIYRTPQDQWERKAISEIEIPETVREVVKQRFNRLDDSTQSTLRIASVLGTEFPFELLKEVAGVGEEPLIEQLERLVRAGLIEETKGPSRLLTYAFTDPQLRQILYDEMLTPRRTRYHRKAAEALEKLTQGHAEEFAGELAYHYREGHDVPRALEFALLAAERSLRVYGYKEAERHYRTALELLEEVPDDRARARALQGLGDVHFALGDLESTVAEWERATHLYESTGEALRAGDLCATLADVVRLNPQFSLGHPQRVEGLLERGRRLLESIPPTRELALLYDELAVRLSETDRLAEARRILEKGLEVARSIGDPDTEQYVRADLLFTFSVREKEKAIASLEEGERYAARAGKVQWSALSSSRNNLTIASLYVTGDPVASLQWSDRAIESGQKSRNRAIESEAWIRRVTPLVWIGRIAEANESVRRSEALRASGASAVDTRLGRALGLLALLRGDFSDAHRWLSKLVDGQSLSLQLQVVPDLAEAYRQQRDLDAAEAVLRRLDGRWPESLDGMRVMSAFPYLRVRAGLVEVLLERPRDAARTREIERLSDAVHELAVVLDNPAGLGLDARLRGALAGRDGRSTAEIAQLEDAVRHFRKSEYVVELPLTLERLARAYREAGDTEKSRSSEEEAETLRRGFRAHRPESTRPAVT